MEPGSCYAPTHAHITDVSFTDVYLPFVKQWCCRESRPIAVPQRESLSDKLGLRMFDIWSFFTLKDPGSFGPWPAGELPITTCIKNTVDGHKSVIGLKYYL